MAYVQGESLKVIVPFLQRFLTPGGARGERCQCLRKHMQDITMLKIEICPEYPHQSLSSCTSMLDMLADMFAATEDLNTLGSNGIAGICMTLNSISEALSTIRDTIESERDGRITGNDVAPSLTQPRKRRSSAAA
ncbi:hypothetical protein [Komagataeibacter sp. FNDCF1]|uniref:hypothetical protein n=1 Tax=Komagataeibacter sp. FNDCF1 TaxID=2878681 RepID=UPI001E4C6AF4|nr:hypothetical protein [Komagataeibacter sp. FNDCF1]MCE2564641.1 hypothetical protein [Komagataeibacter sp. FNDCF1]